MHPNVLSVGRHLLLKSSLALFFFIKRFVATATGLT